MNDDADLTQEYQTLLQFVHMVPVGLVRFRRSGDILMVNPMAAQLLGVLGFDHEGFNLFTMTDRVSPDVRSMVQGFSGGPGVLCENFRLLLPLADAQGDARGDRPQAMGITIVQPPTDPDSLMMVITDDSGALKLERLRAGWIR